MHVNKKKKIGHILGKLSHLETTQIIGVNHGS